MQRMKLHLVVLSSSVSFFIDTTNALDTVVATSFFPFPPPPESPLKASALAFSATAISVAKILFASLSRPCENTEGMASGRGSLFLSSHPLTVYCTGPAKCKIRNESRACFWCTGGKKGVPLWSFTKSRTNFSSEGWIAAHCVLRLSRTPPLPLSKSTQGLLSGQSSKEHKMFSSLNSCISDSNTCLLKTFWRYSLAKLIKICSNPLTLNVSNPKMSSTPINGSCSVLRYPRCSLAISTSQAKSPA
mmetsp:Transcript_82030/g.163877  ORF Transcript_82030/g.163877 Transcript_82030/m.163877 type:complete len:246 (+) Transcript_82030:1279-2016(+)